jgi:hypothetical protein
LWLEGETIVMADEQQRSPGAAREAKRRAGIRTDLRAIRFELGEIRREVEALTARLPAGPASSSIRMQPALHGGRRMPA